MKKIYILSVTVGSDMRWETTVIYLCNKEKTIGWRKNSAWLSWTGRIISQIFWMLKELHWRQGSRKLHEGSVPLSSALILQEVDPHGHWKLFQVSSLNITNRNYRIQFSELYISLFVPQNGKTLKKTAWRLVHTCSQRDLFCRKWF